VYPRELVLACAASITSCCQNLFEGFDEATELLLPGPAHRWLIAAGFSAARHPMTDCDDVEILGLACISLFIFVREKKRGEWPAEGGAYRRHPTPSPSCSPRTGSCLLWRTLRAACVLLTVQPRSCASTCPTTSRRTRDRLPPNHQRPEEIRLPIRPSAAGNAHYAFDLLSLHLRGGGLRRQRDSRP